MQIYRHCHIHKDVAIRRSTTDTEKQGNNVGIQKENTDKSSPIKITKYKQPQNYDLHLQR